MFAPDVRFEGFTAADWMRVLSLFQPRRPGGRPRDPERPKGGVIAVHDQGALIKLVHTEVGRLRLDDVRADWPLPLADLAHRNHASWAASLERGALDAVMEGFGARARRSDDLTRQAITLVELARDQLELGRIELWPRRLRGVPIPSAAVIDGALDSVCPRGRSAVLGLFEDGELWSCLAIRRGAAGIDLVLGPDEVRADMGLLAGDFRRDLRHLARAIEDRAGTLAFGCYAEISTLRRLAVDPAPGAWARAALVRELVLHPMPAGIALPLGLDAGRAAFIALRSAAEELDPLGLAAPALELLRARLTPKPRSPEDGAAADDVDPITRFFGFHPLELLRKMLSRDA